MSPTHGAEPRFGIDHLLWAVPELQSGCSDLEQRWGVVSQPGGRHPNIGTHNALIGLGPARYLEIIAPDPTQDRFSGLGALLSDLKQPTLLTWCIAASDLEAAASTAEKLGFYPSPIQSMQRQRPDGSVLSWRLLFLGGHDLGSAVPFFIDWGTSEHPSRRLASDCRLLRLEIEHPRAPELQSLLDALSPELGRSVRVVNGAVLALRASFSTPNAEMRLETHGESAGSLI